MKSAFAESREANARTIFDPGGNFGVNRTLTQNTALALALGTRIGDDTTSPLAGRTRARNTEKPLLVPYLSPARARPAAHRSLARGCP